MLRPQFSIRALLVTMLVVAAFFGGVKFERERRRATVTATPSPSFTIRMVKQKDGTFVRTISPAAAQNVITGSNSAPGFDPKNPTLAAPAAQAPAEP